MNVTPGHDLRPAFGNARHQGSRPTCCAFACSDLHAFCRGPWEPLSCEYAFFHGIRRQGTDPSSGVFLDHILDAIEQDGQPVEAAWPYLSNLPVDKNAWLPPTDVGQLFHAKATRPSSDLSEVRSAIDLGRPVLIVMTISNAFFAPDGHGVINSTEPVDPTRVHALIAVGHGTRDTDAFILARNSWGSRWGLSGYAWMSEEYLTPRMIEFATMTKVI